MLNPLKLDPTRTTLLRRAFVAAMHRRMMAIRKAILQVVVTEDAFGLDRNNTAPPYGQAHVVSIVPAAHHLTENSNPNHDEKGRFSSSGSMGSVQGTIQKSVGKTVEITAHDTNGRRIGVIELSKQGSKYTVEDVRVSQSMLGRGVGKQLYEAAITYAKVVGATHLLSHQEATSHDAVRVWKSLSKTHAVTEEPFKTFHVVRGQEKVRAVDTSGRPSNKPVFSLKLNSNPKVSPKSLSTLNDHKKLVHWHALDYEDHLTGNATTPTMNTRWQFETDDKKIQAYQDWLKGEVDKNLLTVDPANKAQPWVQPYIGKAYKKGVERAYTDTGGAPGESMDYVQGGKAAFLKMAFDGPIAQTKLKTLSTRAFTNLKGVSADMDKQMTMILAQGLAKGTGARDIGRQLAKSVDTLDATRAAAIARTEIVHAHNEGQLDSFEAMNAEGVGVMAEWNTAHDGRVCPLCAPMEGVILTIKEARGMLPRHPNCRCCYIPANVGEEDGGTTKTEWAPTAEGDENDSTGTTTGQVWSKDEVGARIRESLKAESPGLDAKEARIQSTWVGADTKITGKLKPGSKTYLEKVAAAKAAVQVAATAAKEIAEKAAAKQALLESMKTKAALMKEKLGPLPPTAYTPGDKAGPGIRIEGLDQVSLGYRNEFKRAIASLPANLLKKLHRRGYVFKTGKVLTDVDPSLRGLTPRGWIKGSTWDMVGGFHDQTTKVIATAEEVVDRVTGKRRKTVDMRPLRATILHEFGHGVDAVSGFISSNDPDLVVAYTVEKSVFLKDASLSEREALSYFVQDGFAGRSEFFAEGTTVKYYPEGSVDAHALKKWFPKSMARVSAILDQG